MIGENLGSSKSHVMVSFVGFCRKPCHQLSVAGAVKLASIMYFMKKAKPKSAIRLFMTLVVDISKKRLFHKIQKKQKETIQNEIPLSGVKQLKI